MKKTVFHQIRKLFRLAFFSCLCMGALTAKAQTARITLNMQNVPLEQVMNEIKNQTRYLFVNKDVADIQQPVSIRVTNELITGTLNQLFSQTNIGYKIDQTSIFIFDKRNIAAEKPVSIKGRVLGSNGEPIIGAAVVV
ncbi:MAG: SusC/RagA family protein, partial [Alistipes sp.]